MPEQTMLANAVSTAAEKKVRINGSVKAHALLSTIDKCGCNLPAADKNYRMSRLDRFDLRILEALQRDAKPSMPILASEIGLSTPACYRRIRALREIGAIKREVALVAPEVMGWPVTMIVLVSLERDRGHIVDHLVRKLKASPVVMDVWYVTGDHDLVLQVAAENMAEYDTFTREVLHAEDHVQSFKTLVVLQHPKWAAPLGTPT